MTKKIKRQPVKSPKRNPPGPIKKRARQSAKELALQEFKRLQDTLESQARAEFTATEIIDAKGEIVAKAAPETKGKRADGELIPPDMFDSDGEINRDYLRYAAGLYFTLSLEGVTLEEMNSHPIYGQVPISNLRAWKKADNWVDRRASNLERWKGAIEKKIGDKLVKTRVEALENLQCVYEKALEHLKDEKIAPKSWEGVARVAIQTADLMVNIQDKIAAHVNPASQPGQSGALSQAPTIPIQELLSDDEAFEAAQCILRLRQTKTGGEDDAEQSADPLKLLQGGRSGSGS